MRLRILWRSIMEDFTTNSQERLRWRTMIRGVIEAWVHGPVELLVGSDVRELRRKISAEFTGRRAGWEYVCFLTEVDLALGIEGDALRRMRSKGPAPSIDLRGLNPAARDWLGDAEKRGVRVKVFEDVGPREELGELFVNLESNRKENLER